VCAAVIKVSKNHNHHLACAATLRKNRLTKEAVQNLEEKFEQGYQPAKTKKLIAEELREKCAASLSPSNYHFNI